MLSVTVFGQSDLKKNGEFKVKNSVMVMNEEEFKKYVKSNGLTASHGYFDNVGDLSNGKKFKCRYSGIIVGVSGIVKELKEVV